MNIVGINFSDYHESSVCLLQDGKLVFACAEERLSRLKQDKAFPRLAIQATLEFAGLKPKDVDHVSFTFPNPWRARLHDLKLFATRQFPLDRRRLEMWTAQALKGHRHKGGELDYRRAFGAPRGGFHFPNHHLCHALSAWCLSGFDEAAVLVIDGRGSHEATTLWKARGDAIDLLETIEFPNSVGVFYAGITGYLGFEPLADEWKVMGLAAYGKPGIDMSPLIRCNQESYDVAGRRFLRASDGRRGVEDVLGPKRHGDAELEQRHMDVARAAQDACEQAMLAMLRRVTRRTGIRKLCLAGGVALNCKANGELLRSGLIDDIYVQPAAGDDGACIGAALAVYASLNRAVPRNATGSFYLGQEERVLQTYKLPYRRLPDPPRAAAELLARDRLVGWFQGRMEFGPRALGNRSILSNPRFRANTDRVNEAVKFREKWRPFAPSVAYEKAQLYFEDFYDSPYMILSFWANKARAAEIPAVVHVDGSCRVQSVRRETNSRYYDLLMEFEKLAGVPVVMNTSFNLKGDPIVCTPKDAMQTFYASGLDDLIIGDCLLSKRGLAELSP